MRVHALTAVAAVLLAGADGPRQSSVGELAQLRGDWRLVSTADAQRADLGSAHIKMIIGDDGRILFKFGALTTNRGTIKISRSGKTPVLDLQLVNGQTVLCVFELFGSDLVICCDEAGKGRPAGLAPTGTQWVERWRRVRP